MNQKYQRAYTTESQAQFLITLLLQIVHIFILYLLVYTFRPMTAGMFPRGRLIFGLLAGLLCFTDCFSLWSCCCYCVSPERKQGAKRPQDLWYKSQDGGLGDCVSW